MAKLATPVPPGAAGALVPVATRLLTPASRRPRPLPRIAVGALAVAEIATLAVAPSRGPLALLLHVVCKLAAALAACSLATWLEDRVYTSSLSRSAMARVGVAVALPLAAVAVLPLGAALFGAIALAAGDRGTLLLGLLCGCGWLGSAAIGSAVVVLLDALISALVPDFRSRVQLAILVLLGIAAGAAAGLSAGGRALAELARARATQPVAEDVMVGLGGDGLRGEQARQLLGLFGTPGFVAYFFGLAAVLVALPATLSACGKLADSVMERLHPLSLGFEEVSAGRLAVRVEEAGSRDFIKMGQGFNRMVQSLAQTMTDLDARNRELGGLHRAASRFVPVEFLELLDKGSLDKVARGDQIELDMSVLFADIRGFTTMAEAKGAASTFALINRYLGHVEPEIHRQGGFINDFAGDGIMALFHRGADSAVRASLGMLAAVQRLDRELEAEGRNPIRIGIGINSGRLMLGTIGGADRLSCTVVGDPVNLASRVESMTKLYGVRLLVTEHTRARLAEPASLAMREIDRVQAKGKREPVVLFEVLDGCPFAERETKLASREAFAAALEAYRAGRIDEARRNFEALAARPTLPSASTAAPLPRGRTSPPSRRASRSG
jgi:class 3 adenylate cyclase